MKFLRIWGKYYNLNNWDTFSISTYERANAGPKNLPRYTLSVEFSKNGLKDRFFYHDIGGTIGDFNWVEDFNVGHEGQERYLYQALTQSIWEEIYDKIQQEFANQMNSSLNTIILSQITGKYNFDYMISLLKKYELICDVEEKRRLTNYDHLPGFLKRALNDQEKK